MIDLEKVADFVKRIHAGNKDGHGFEHIERVVALAEKILSTEATADKELVLVAAYLHDSYDVKICDDQPAQKLKIQNFLSALTLKTEKIQQVFYIIDNMSFSANLSSTSPLDINGQIVQDADRLEAMGATMIVRTLQYGWAHNRILYNPSITPKIYKNADDYHQDKTSTTINHFYEKAFLLKNLLNTAKAREMGYLRDKIMHDFVEAYEREWKDAH